ncbi:MAG: CBS domain-containing protein [Phototrophicaceae bacterium]|jgi:tRNA nucleotidyltransferase (CCA-adding enzyme)
MTTVQQIMSFSVLTVTPDLPLSSLIRRLRRIGHEGYPVVENGQVVGLLTARDMNRAAEHGLSEWTVRAVMQHGEVFVLPTTPLGELLQRMTLSGWGQIPVMANGQVIGIVTRTDVIRYYAQQESQTPAPRRVTRAEIVAGLGEAAAQLIQFIAQQAARQDVWVYLVGGTVRDLMLQRPSSDFDFVIEGDAIQFGQALQIQFGGDLQIHSAFGTAKWSLDERCAASIGCLLADVPESVDLISARHEFYQSPAVLPNVYTSGIALDLRRRDFTINTLALSLATDGNSGTLIDRFNGLQDIQDKRIRALHPLSFVDDPTRIFRAVRYAHRLGFEIEAHTAAYLHNALPQLAHTTGERLRNEITLMLSEQHPAQGIRKLQAMGVFAGIHPRFAPNEHLEGYFAQQKDIVFVGGTFMPKSWLILAATLPPDIFPELTQRLLFDNKYSNAMLATAQLMASPASAFERRPSEITFWLEAFPLEAVAVAQAFLPESHSRAMLMRYLTVWRYIRIHTDGETLKALGLPPSPQYRVILTQLRAARINGEVQSDEQELALLAQLTTQP